IVGLALDYGQALSRKAVLRTAADAAALAALSQAQSDYARGATSTQMTSDAQAAAQRAFVVNAGQQYSLLTATPTIIVQRNGQTMTANVSYQANSPNLFGAFANSPYMTYSGASASSMT